MKSIATLFLAFMIAGCSLPPEAPATPGVKVVASSTVDLDAGAFDASTDNAATDDASVYTNNPTDDASAIPDASMSAYGKLKNTYYCHGPIQNTGLNFTYSISRYDTGIENVKVEIYGGADPASSSQAILYPSSNTYQSASDSVIYNGATWSLSLTPGTNGVSITNTNSFSFNSTADSCQNTAF
jgi:hypothetical protein